MNLDPIAVIGMAGRFPGAADIARFWRNLSDGVESVTFFSREELLDSGVVVSLLDDPLYVRASAVLDGVEMFDADFFGFTPREAEITDPQHRVFLECAWEALEDSGYDPEAYDGQIGVYAGAGLSTYLLNYLLRRPDVLRSAGALHLQLGNNKDYVPLRVSYKLHLRGPSVNVNTACSSSLVAVHLACQSLLDQQCDIALAGGVGIQVPQHQGYLYAPNGILSFDGHCRAFDAGAEGTVSGNGAGLVVLKRYAEAVADGDAIRAVILGSAINNDGATKVGFTAPSIEGQARVIGEALAVADVDPDTLGYVEAHGTGTPLGDPIEVAALTSVFRSYTARTGFCALGSVKTNVGHLDEAAGVAGLVKTVLALQHAAIPPSLHFERPNPEIDFERSPFYVPTRLSPWAANGAPRRAGVSSFGIGGTNAHVVLQEAPLPEPAAPSRPWQLLLLSARTEMALDALTAGLAAHFRGTPGIDLADAAYTLLVGRKNFPHRRMVLCRDIDGAVNALESRRPDRVVTALAASPERPVAFLFPGQGSQHVNMGLGLYRTEPVFRETLDRAAERLRPELGFDLRTVLYPPEARAEEAARLEQTAVAQPALYAVEYALARLLIGWGIRPGAMSGHSIGEYVAAALAGVFSFEDGLRLVAARGRLMQEMPAGAMLAVKLSEDELGPYLRQGPELALANAPSLSVVSGAIAAVDALQQELSACGIACRRLHTSRAFHSASMEPILETFRQRVLAVPLAAPEIPFLSNLTGRWITSGEATDPDYWVRHLRHTVRFSDGVRQLLREPSQVFLEVGPGRTLGTLIGRHPECTSERLVLGALRHRHDPRDDAACLLEAVGRLWLAGACRKPAGFYAAEKRRRVPLPTYPFERRRFWLDPPAESAAEEVAAPVSAAVDEVVGDWFYLPAWNPRRAAGLPGRDETGGASWLLFLDAEGVGGRLAERLRGQGRSVATVVAGAAFERLGDGAYALDSRRPEDYDALLGGLAASGLAPRRIVHLWSVAPPAAVPLERWEDAQRLGFYSLLFLAQALGRRGLVENLCIDVVSSHMQQVAGGELSCPEKAPLLGLVRVAPKEYPGIRWRSIDLAPPAGGSSAVGSSQDLLLAEILSHDPAPVIAIRGDVVWEQAFAARHLPAADAAPARLREGGTYLISGGLGSMGLVLARYLAKEVRARLVLIGRTELPPEAEWDGWLRSAGLESETVGAAAPPSSVDFDPAAETELVESLESRAKMEAALTDVDGDERLQALLHGYCSRLIGRYFAECGVELAKGYTYGRNELRRRLRVLPQFEKFLAFLLRALAEDGIVRVGADGIEVLSDEGRENPAAVREVILAEYPKFQGLATFLEHCTARYAPALSGEIRSISVLYPDGTPALLDQSGRDTPAYAGDGVYLETAARLVARLADKPAGEKLRILEVGGGSGGLTRSIVQALGNRAVDYLFTDLGQSFVRRAEREAAAGGIDFMRFGLFDIAREPEAQGYARHGFDLVLGYNVVHATPKIGETVGHLRSLLAPGGLLVLVETTRLRRWDEMVWGLTEGWWHYTDERLRGDSPLLGLGAWEELLRGRGFDLVAAYPREERARRTADTGLIVARQPRAPAETDVRSDAAESARIRAAIAAVRDIRRLGGEVLAIPADLADESRMRPVLAQVRERFGEIHGVIHAAGVLGQGLIHTKTPYEARKVFAAKAVGLLLLDKLLAEQGTEPDFLILCASLASVSPIAGQVDYCAANAFLDAYAAYRSGFGRTAAISIDWGFWQELGMIGQAKMPEAWKQRIVDEIREQGRSGAGVEAFRRILAHCPPPQVLVTPDRPDELPLLQVPAVAMARRRPVHHPWFDECVVETPELEIYISRLHIRHWVLHEHRPLGRAVLPGTAYLELARAAMETHGPGRPLQLSEVYFLVPLVVEDHETKEVRTLLKKRDAGFEFVVVSRAEAGADEWLEHARGEIVFLAAEPPSALDPDSLAQRCGDEDIVIGDGDSADEAHPFVRRVRHFPPHWRNFQRLRLGSGEALATLRLPAEFAGEPADLPLHPALLDMATGFMSMVDGFESGVPFCYRRVCLWRPLASGVHSHVRRVENRQPDERSYDATILDDAGNVLMEVAGFTLKAFAEAADTPALPEEQRNFCVEIERSGSLATLGLRPDRRRSPAPGEVEIEVAAAGLNFIEVLYALGLLPEPPGGGVRFGLECAGAITAVGEGVAGFRPGDEVYGLAPHAFSRYTTTAANAIALKPEHLTLGEAATLPAAFTTAYYSLIIRGRLRRGERVLIHAASGGVGLAAVNIAEWRGAEIFATAGTPAKREYLHSLGIRHVFDSRALDFAGQVLAATEGRGVDAVLNSLGGEFIPASLSVLARYGRFLELGKRDIFRNTALGLAPFEKHLAFFAIDVGTDLPEFEFVWRQVVRAVQRQIFRSLPYREFSVSRVAEAFEYMAQGKHIGKVVVAIGGADGVSVSARRRRGRPLADIVGRGRTEQRSGHQTTAEAKSLEAARGAAWRDPGHARPALSTAYRDPAGETEARVVAIWQELLGVSAIGIDDNFFELRGDSLLAAQVTSRLYEAFRVKLPLSSVFEHPTAAGLAARIEQLRESLRELEAAPAALPGEREVEHEL